MTSYNGEDYIETQLRSILSQLDLSDEIIICDDGSTDNTLKIITEIDDPRIRVFQNSFKSVIYNFESAIEKAQGEYIFLSDQDDIWYEDKVSQIIVHLENNLLVFSNVSIFNDNQPEALELLFDPTNNMSGLIKNFISNNYIGATMAFNKKLLQYILPFPKNLNMHDSWIGLIGEIYGNSVYIDKPLIYYRRHFSNLSTTGGRSDNTFSKKLKIRIVLFVQIIRRIFRNM